MGTAGRRFRRAITTGTATSRYMSNPQRRAARPDGNMPGNGDHSPQGDDMNGLRLQVAGAVLAAALAGNGCVSTGEFEKLQADKNQEIDALQKQRVALEQQTRELQSQRKTLEEQRALLERQQRDLRAELAALAQ